MLPLPSTDSRAASTTGANGVSHQTQQIAREIAGLNFKKLNKHQSVTEQAINDEACRQYWKAQLDGARRASFPGKIHEQSHLSSQKSVFKKSILLKNSSTDAETIAVILRAAWAIVLARYCDAEDVCFGSTVPDRPTPVLERELMAGSNNSLVPVRIQLDRSQTILQFLQEIRDGAATSRPHEYLGLHAISELSPDSSEACDFSSLLITQSSLKNEETSSLSSILLSVGENEDSLFQAARTLKYPLIAQAKIMDAQFELQMAYNPDIMTEFQITAFSNHVENVTQQLLKQDITLLSEVSIAGTWDVQQVAQWHPEPVIVRRCIHDLITEQALRDPMHEALYWTGGNMTYGELEHISTNFAIYLTRLGVKPGTMVPICFEKNPWAIVAMLAILKAGGAYVPLDPTHPLQRRQSFVDEVEAQVIIVSSSTASSCKGMATHIVELSAPLLSSLSDPIREEIRQKPTPSHAAYIIYTSGSTGKPKGAVIQHEALSSAMIGLQRAFGMGQMTRTLQFSNFVFDVSVGDIFATLVGGGTVCVPTAAERLENAPAFMVAARVNTAMLTPSFVRTFTPDQVPCLQTLVTGGEPHGRDTLETWVGRVKYINAYGPTETIVYSTGHEYESPHSPTHNIGIDRHGKSWIVEQNNHHHFTPIGCVGEIVYQGVGLARDYYKNEEKTKEYFIENSPWLPHYDGIRDIFYKTGDLGRFNPDGTMTILGRTDYQVKLRGQRLELGEVEYHITKSDSIQYASTDVLKKPTGDALVAFISFYNKGNKPTEQDDLILPLDGPIKKIVKDVVKDLKAKLPEVMVPTIFLPLREMPMLAGLKIGRKDLRNIANSLTPEQIETYSLVKETKTAPTDPKELVIRELWADVLDMEPEEIDQSDDFLKLGGDHISAVYLVTAAKARGLKLTVDTIFQSPGLASMAAVAERIESRTASSVQPFSLLRGLKVESVKSAIQHQCKLTAKESIADAYPCTAVQAELFLSANTNSETHFTKMVYKLPSRVGLAQFKHAWEKTIRKCPNLRTRVIQFEGRPIQAIVNNDPHWQANPSEVSGPDVKMGYGIPLCRYALAPDNAGTQHFHLCMHHAIYDVSTIREMFKILHQSYMSRPISELPAYAKFVEYTQRLDSEAATEFWQTQLEDVVPTQFPPRSNSPAADKAALKSTISFEKDTELLVPHDILIRAAWALLISHGCESPDICFGTTVSSLHASTQGLERVPGRTTATVPLRVRVDEDQYIADFLQDIQDQFSDMAGYEQFGLHNIAKVSDEAKSACDFASLLVVKPGVEEVAKATEATLLLAADGKRSLEGEAMKGYHQSPFLARASVFDDRFEMTFSYHQDALTEAQVKEMSLKLQHVVQQLLTQEEIPLSEVSFDT